MRSIREIVQGVVDWTDAVDVGSAVNAVALAAEICEALTEAGYAVDPPVSGARWAPGEQSVRGIVTIQAESKHKDGEQYGRLDLKIDGTVWMTPKVIDNQWDEPVFSYYDVVIEGFSVPLNDDGKTHMQMRMVES